MKYQDLSVFKEANPNRTGIQRKSIANPKWVFKEANPNRTRPFGFFMGQGKASSRPLRKLGNVQNIAEFRRSFSAMKGVFLFQ